MCTIYGGVRQRWLVVWSAQAENRERVALQKQVERERQDAEEDWKALQRREFPSQEAAEEAVAAWAGRWAFHGVEAQYHQVAHYQRRGRPALGKVPQRVGWRVQGEVVERPEAIVAAEKGLGKFILATNELDEERLPAEEVLAAYKDAPSGRQGSVVRRGALAVRTSLGTW